uniref:NADH-ubiquinone oxidoreductase chain 5 n=1 Tax=Prionospio plumosa TaxID=3050096 RepID=A0AAU6QGJ2_9ANNE
MPFTSVPLISSIILYFIVVMMAPLSLTLLMNNYSIIMEWSITNISSPISLTLIADPYGTLLSIVVLLISANVMIFTHSYMSEDPFMSRFVILVLLFVASMNLLIFIPNLITLLIGWDGLGLTSFLLVIYYQNPKSLGAGMITALTNRIGDVLILISIAWTLNIGNWNLLYLSSSPFLPMISVALMVAAMTKSAQMPFSSWLPAAMAAPTPVSALVHSSTLVTAGVFLLFRFYPFLSSFLWFNKLLLMVATLTTLMAGLSANTECDMKKIIALSTLSQLGVMMVSLGLGCPLLAFFHLITHALFKALLFLCAGTLIHLHHHSQDLRYMGNLPKQAPSIIAPMMVSNLALCGAPFLAGFYSKDAILEYSLFSPTSFIIIILFFFATGLTVSYTIRFLLVVAWGPSNISPFHPINDNDFSNSLPTFTLAFLAIIGGSSLNWILVCPNQELFLTPFLKNLTISVCLLGLIFGYYLSSTLSSQRSFLLVNPMINSFSTTMWFLTPLSAQKSLSLPMSLALLFHKTLDQGWEESFGGQGALSLTLSSGSFSMLPQSNMISSQLSICFFSLPILIMLFYM